MLSLQIINIWRWKKEDVIWWSCVMSCVRRGGLVSIHQSDSKTLFFLPWRVPDLKWHFGDAPPSSHTQTHTSNKITSWLLSNDVMDAFQIISLPYQKRNSRCFFFISFRSVFTTAWHWMRRTNAFCTPFCMLSPLLWNPRAVRVRFLFLYAP